MRPLILVALLSSACSSLSPTTPAPTPTPTPTPASYTIAGTVTATNGGQVLGGLSVLLNGLATTTNGAGAFTYTLTSGTTARLTLDGAGIVSRALTLQSASARTVAVQAISLSNGFDLTFYRQLVRNGFEAPAQLQPLRRWTRTPQIYLKTVDEAGEAIHAPTLDLIEATLRTAVPEWTGGVLGVPMIERGTGTRVGQTGWITVRFPATEATTFCGQAQVGMDGGWIDLSYHVPSSAPINCRGDGTVISLSTMRHEVGHALGFWHAGDGGDLMNGHSYTSNNQHPSARELAAAAIAYARPVGNLDPDSDPSGTVSLAPMRIP